MGTSRTCDLKAASWTSRTVQFITAAPGRSRSAPRACLACCPCSELCIDRAKFIAASSRGHREVCRCNTPSSEAQRAHNKSTCMREERMEPKSSCPGSSFTRLPAARCSSSKAKRNPFHDLEGPRSLELRVPSPLHNTEQANQPRGNPPEAETGTPTKPSGAVAVTASASSFHASDLIAARGAVPRLSPRLPRAGATAAGARYARHAHDAGGSPVRQAAPVPESDRLVGSQALRYPLLAALPALGATAPLRGMRVPPALGRSRDRG